MSANRQTYMHTTFANAVTLVWGSLRLSLHLSAVALYYMPMIWEAGSKYILSMGFHAVGRELDRVRFWFDSSQDCYASGLD